MKNHAKPLALLLITWLFFGFTADTSYDQEIKEWHRQRIDKLKEENGWLNLAGLFWLEEGENTFGNDAKNAVVFPADRSKDFLGKFILKDGKVTLQAKEGAAIFAGDQPVKQLEVFPTEKPIVLRHNSLRWFIIKRGDKYAVRLRDLESPQLKAFKGIDTYPVNPEWRVKAKFIPSKGTKIAITEITGMVSDKDSPGTLVFSLNGKEYRLDAVEGGGDGQLFVIFADQSNEEETYATGRFVYPSAPDASGYTWLDFNKAINPPCAFTPYATCPLPPKQNRLSVAIAAGEKRYENH